MKTAKMTKPKASSAKAKPATAGQAKAKAPPLKSSVAKKTAVKTPVKTAVKATVKTKAKAPVKGAVKPTVKAATPAKKTATKVVSKAAPAQKVTAAPKATPVKAKANPVSPSVKKPVKAASPPAPAAPKAVKAPAAPKAVVAPPVKSMNVTKVAPSQTIAEAAPVAVAPDQLVRATRPSARLAQITVPSLPPAVASTAAKSSFLPSAPSPVVTMTFAPIKKDPKLANNWKSKKVEELSDAEILAMPDAEYMNDAQMAFFRLKLARLKQEILASAGQTTEHLREDTVVVPDPADRATIEEEHALELRTRDRERKLLKKIEQSIIRIDAGDYGFCDETGEAIGVGRLLARPTATLSLEAQQRRELKQKMFGD